MGTDFAQLLQVGRSDMDDHGALQRSEEDHWVEVLRGLNSDPKAQDRWAWLAAGFLLATPSRRVRNAAALALAEMGAHDAGGSIVAVLRRPEMAKAAGTLLYALGELGASLPLGVFVGLIENGSYEARAMALTFIEENRIDGRGDAEVADARIRLMRLAGDAHDPEGAEAADLALDYLTAG